MEVRKRLGTVVPWDTNKIRKALLAAMASCGEDAGQIEDLVSDIEIEIKDGGYGSPIDIRDIEAVILSVLFDNRYHGVAKSFIEYREKRALIRSRRSDPRVVGVPKGLSDYILASKYARGGETYVETIERVEAMHAERYASVLRSGSGSKFKEMWQFSWGLAKDMRVLPSMRSMQFAGPAIVANNMRMYNCAFLQMTDLRFLGRVLWLLLSGTGVGYSVQRCHVEQMRPLTRVDPRSVAHHVVSDTIEGWAQAVEAVVSSYCDPKSPYYGCYVEVGYHLIRPQGSLLKTSHGSAPGHLGLKAAIEAVRAVLDRAAGRKLRPLEVHDCCCFLAEAVLSGGIRRASMLALFSADDGEMFNCKTRGVYDPGSGLNAQRAMANNSVLILRSDPSGFDTLRRAVLAARDYGEPGFYFASSCDDGCNPCGEIGFRLTAGQVGLCNLTEINGEKCRSAEEFFAACKAAAFIGTLQAGYLDPGYLGQDALGTAAFERLLGVGIMGMMDQSSLFFGEDSDLLLRAGASLVAETNSYVAAQIGIPAGARLTTIKPSGTSSLLAGAIGAGIHGHHARRYFRRVTCNKDEAAYQAFKAVNPGMCFPKNDRDDVIIFPIQVGENAVLNSDLVGIAHLFKIQHVMRNWIVPGNTRKGSNLNHNVSATVILPPDSDLDAMIQYIWDWRSEFGALSFVPETLDRVYPFAPREAVSEDTEGLWNQLIRSYRAVDYKARLFSKDGGKTMTLEPACSGGSCEL